MDHDRYPVSDWQYEVANGDTRLGYNEWLKVKLDSEPNLSWLITVEVQFRVTAGPVERDAEAIAECLLEECDLVGSYKAVKAELDEDSGEIEAILQGDR